MEASKNGGGANDLAMEDSKGVVSYNGEGVVEVQDVEWEGGINGGGI